MIRGRFRLAAGAAGLVVVIAAVTGCGGGHRGVIASRTIATSTSVASTVATSIPPTPPTTSVPDTGSTQPLAPHRSTASAAGATRVAAPPAPAAIPIIVPASTLVATLGPAGASGSGVPGGTPTIHVPGSWLGAASVLPVIAQQPGWVELRLAQRPNESTAWVPSGGVALATDPYYVVIDLRTTRLLLYQSAREIADFPAGVGTPSVPTPAGQFFVALFAAAPSPGYGAFVIVTSAHSNTISDWEASGDAITAIHGSLGADAAIGTSGARISHGCIRLHNGDLARLRDVPAGTPVDIVA